MSRAASERLSDAQRIGAGQKECVPPAVTYLSSRATPCVVVAATERGLQLAAVRAVDERALADELRRIPALPPAHPNAGQDAPRVLGQQLPTSPAEWSESRTVELCP